MLYEVITNKLKIGWIFYFYFKNSLVESYGNKNLVYCCEVHKEIFHYKDHLNWITVYSLCYKDSLANLSKVGQSLFSLKLLKFPNIVKKNKFENLCHSTIFKFETTLHNFRAHFLFIKSA